MSFVCKFPAFRSRVFFMSRSFFFFHVSILTKSPSPPGLYSLHITNVHNFSPKYSINIYWVLNSEQLGTNSINVGWMNTRVLASSSQKSLPLLQSFWRLRPTVHRTSAPQWPGSRAARGRKGWWEVMGTTEGLMECLGNCLIVLLISFLVLFLCSSL